MRRSLGYFNYCVCLCITALLAAGFPVPANAYKVGDIDISPIISMDEKYDDNITSAKTDKIQDYITSLSLGVEASAQGKTRELSLVGSVDHELYSKEKGFDNTAENLSLSYATQMDQFQRAHVQESFTHAETPQTFADEFGQIGTRRRSYYLNRFGMGYSKDISKQFSISAGYQNEIYNRSGEDSTDSFLNGVNLRGDYSFSSATIVSSALGFSQHSYDPGSDIYSTTADALLRQYMTKQFYADLMAGLSYIKVGSGGDSFTEPRYQLTLTDEVSQKTKYTWSIQKQQTTNYWSSDVFDQWRTSLGISHGVYQRLWFNTFFFYGQGKYISQNNKDKFTGVSGRLDYDVTPVVTAFLSHTYSNSASDIGTRDYSRNITMIGVRGKF